MYFLMDCTDENLLKVLGLVKTVFNLIKIFIPVALLIFGALDLGKAVMAGEEKEIKAATSLLIKRVIAAVAVFLLVTLVTMILGIVGKGTEFTACWNAANTKAKFD